MLSVVKARSFVHLPKRFYSQKCALVCGGSGQLGREVVQKFSKENWLVVSADFSPNSHATKSILLEGSPDKDCKNILSSLEGKRLDAVISVAGGWDGGDIRSDNLFDSCHKMWEVNMVSGLVASRVAAETLSKDGLLVLTGSMAATQPTPSMIGYGLAKAATHHLVKSLSQSEDVPCVVAVLPGTLDTATNRKYMPDADKSTWTSLDFVAKLVFGWSNGTQRPKSGTLVNLKTANSVSTTEVIE